MLSRSQYSSTIGRSAAMRRLRRRVSTTPRLFCSTNGCASFLVIDADGHEATCPICGYRRHLG